MLNENIFRDAFAELCLAMGMEMSEIDQLAIEDEHVRLQYYREAKRDTSLLPYLLTCLKIDPDPLAASSPLVELLECSPPESRPSILEAAQPGNYPFVYARDKEISLSERMINPRNHEIDESDIEMIASGSNWLQLRVSTTSNCKQVLGSILERGRTKRIRREASNRLRYISKYFKDESGGHK